MLRWSPGLFRASCSPPIAIKSRSGAGPPAGPVVAADLDLFQVVNDLVEEQVQVGTLSVEVGHVCHLHARQLDHIAAATLSGSFSHGWWGGRQIFGVLTPRVYRCLAGKLVILITTRRWKKILIIVWKLLLGAPLITIEHLLLHHHFLLCVFIDPLDGEVRDCIFGGRLLLVGPCDFGAGLMMKMLLVCWDVLRGGVLLCVPLRSELLKVDPFLTTVKRMPGWHGGQLLWGPGSVLLERGLMLLLVVVTGGPAGDHQDLRWVLVGEHLEAAGAFFLAVFAQIAAAGAHSAYLKNRFQMILSLHTFHD